MATSHRRRNMLGYDLPYHRDWLFGSALLVSATGGAIGLVRGSVWWEALASVCGGILMVGLVIGSLRELIRGFREPRSTD